MKNKLIITLIIFVVIAILYGIFSLNSVKKKFGMDIHIEAPKNCDVLNITWKGDNIWLFVQDTITDQKRFVEYSNMGILESEVIIK